MGEKEPSRGASRIPDIIVLMMWAGAFLFLLNGERYRYYLAPAFGVTLAAGVVLSAAMGAALGRSRAPVPAPSWIGRTIRALVLVLPLVYAVMTSGAVLDSHAFTKRWVGGLGAGSSRGETRTVENSNETNDEDDAELAEAYKAAGPPKVPRALRKMLGLHPAEEPPVRLSTQNSEKGVVEADLYDLAAYADRFKGRQVTTEGMVAWDESDVSRFYLFRFLIVCCVADAQPVAVLVERGGATERPRQNAWVRVEGVAGVTKVGSETAVIIRNPSVTSMQAPRDPYLY